MSRVSMKPVALCLLIMFFGVTSGAQNSSPGAKPASRATIEGIVTKEPGSEAVKKALIELIAENQTEGGDYTATTGADGTFRIEGILPGRYRLFAERTGFLELDKHHSRTDGRVLTLTAGQELKDVQIRLQAAAVMRGRVTDEDGDPLPEAQVAVMRQTYISGRSRWEQVGAERSNDLGEFRVANLPAGNYYVSVSPPPDFKSLFAGAGAGGDAGKTEKSATSYQPTYYPGTNDRSQATPIQLHAGDEFPMNFSLTPSPSLSIRGSVVNVPPHASAAIMLQSRDFNVVLNGAEMHKDGSFVIHDVAPGAYTILATVENAAAPMLARQSVQVVANNIDDLRLAPQAGGSIRGRLRMDGQGGASLLNSRQMFLALHPVSGEEDVTAFGGEGFSQLAQVAGDGSFEWKGVPAGNYYVQFAGDAGANAEWYLKASANGDGDEAGISVSGGVRMLDLLASANGAAVDGLVADQKGDPVANAVIVAVPELRLRGRLERYRTTVSDQSGRFTLHAIPPGDYTLFAWESLDGEAYYNAEFLKSYEGQGTALRLGDAERKSVKVTAIAVADDQP